MPVATTPRTLCLPPADLPYGPLRRGDLYFIAAHNTGDNYGGARNARQPVPRRLYVARCYSISAWVSYIYARYPLPFLVHCSRVTAATRGNDASGIRRLPTATSLRAAWRYAVAAGNRRHIRLLASWYRNNMSWAYFTILRIGGLVVARHSRTRMP